MNDLAELFRSARVIDYIVGLVVLEAIALHLIHYLTQTGPSPARFVFNLGAGVGLLLALRVALSHGAWPLIALFLGLSLIAHLLDLRTRWSSRVQGHADARMPAECSKPLEQPALFN